MLYLLRKTSDSRDLTAAMEKLKKKYSLKERQVDRLPKKFYKMGINPITLPNTDKGSSLDEIETALKK